MENYYHKYLKYKNKYLALKNNSMIGGKIDSNTNEPFDEKSIIVLPKGTLFKMNSSVKNFDYSDNSFFNMHHSSDEYIYSVGDSQVKCLNCPASENEFDDVASEDQDSIETTTVSVKVAGKELIKTVTKTPRN